MAYAPQGDEPELIVAPAVPLGHVQRRLLDAGRILVTGGWLVLINYTISNRDGNAAHALVGLALLLLGVFLIELSLVADLFPGAARVGAGELACFWEAGTTGLHIVACGDARCAPCGAPL